MTATEIMNSDAFQKCVEFHGHICPGLATGFRAAQAAMEKLKEGRAEDEEMIAIVETDACSADAVQVLTGCTFGKGNFIYRDFGKMVLTLFSRNSGKGVRVAVRPNAFPTNEEHHQLIQKMIAGEANDDEQKRFGELHMNRTKDLLEAPFDDVFNIQETTTEIPPKARIEVSALCSNCGEPVMPSKMETVNGQKVCRGCS